MRHESPRRIVRWRGGALAALLVSAPPGAVRAGDFASVVLEYAPAPGQFINNGAFNDPMKALGPPVGGGTVSADNSKVVSLGGFGGSITLGFGARVMDDPRNPLGLDFIVFGNAVWVNGDPGVRFAEAAVVEISLDENGDGLANDEWFVIRGSHLPAAPLDAWRAQQWDNVAGNGVPPVNTAWYPGPVFYPGHPPMYETTAFELPALFRTDRLMNPNGAGAIAEGVFGYAECSPTLLLGDMTGASGAAGDNSLSDAEDEPGIDPAEFYTVPDDPMAVGIDAGSGGGDAFDIAWAVDAETGAPADLSGFDFVRMTVAVDAVFGPGGVLGEVSAEIGAVADVRAVEGAAEDLNGDGVVNSSDLGLMLGSWGACPMKGACPADLTNDGMVNSSDLARLLGAWGMGA